MFNWLNEIQFRQIIGRFKLTFSELEEILLDREINLNNRPFTYFEDPVRATLSGLRQFLATESL